jgi:hypothetical protein
MARTVTFSDRKVVDFIEKNFVPAWESVAPVTTVTYPLGEERSVQGILTGEIALYVCRPDGKVIDILPGLYSPAATLAALKDALVLYKESDRGQNVSVIQRHHKDPPALRQESGYTFPHQPDSNRSEIVLKRRIESLEAQIGQLKKRAEELADAPDESTRGMRNAKNVVSVYGATIAAGATFTGSGDGAIYTFSTIVPAGRSQYKRHMHSLMSGQGQLKTPSDWKDTVFEEVLGHSLTPESAVFEDSDLNWEKGVLVID